MKKERESISSGAEKVETLAKRSEAAKEEEKARVRAAVEREEERAKERLEAAQRKAEKKQEKAAMEKAREEKRDEKRARKAEKKDKEERGRTPGFGGWLAAVISLGIAVLALGAVVTIGYFDLTEAKAGLYNGYQSSVYELSELVENMDVNLSKARVATGNYEMQKVLTDILVESELAESCLQSFPVDAHDTENLTSFVNRVGDYSRKLLNKLALGGEITDEEQAVIEYMYETTHKIKEELGNVIANSKEKNIDDVLKEGGFAERFKTLENDTIETPKMIYDGPFAAGAQSGQAAALKGLAKCSEQEIEETARSIFADYKVTELRLLGRTEMKGFAAYSLEFRTETGDRYFAQMTEQGGKLMLLDSYKDCGAHNFDAHACIGVAETFLAKLGYEGLEAVWVSESGTACDINFAYVQGGVVCYNDLVKVKVCEERGVVTGLEAHSYLMNHTVRDIPAPTLSQSKIERAAASRMDLNGVRLALIPVEGEETLAYEINGTHGGSEYYAYIDARTGKMVELFTVIDSSSGRALM